MTVPVLLSWRKWPKRSWRRLAHPFRGAGTTVRVSRRDLPSLAAPAADGAAAAEPIEIVFVTTESSDSSAALYAPIKQEFREENPHLDVRFLGVVGGGWGSYFDKLSVTIAGGATVDMGKIPTEGGRLAVARGLVRPLDEFIQATPELDAYFDDVSPELANAFVYGGKTYGLPYDYNNMMIWFNVNRLAEEGLDMPPEDWTFSDFREYAVALNGTATTRRTTGSVSGPRPSACAPGCSTTGWKA